MTDTMLPVLRQFHEADGDAARAAQLLRLPDSIVLKYSPVLTEACRRAGFAAGESFVAIRVAAMMAVRDARGDLAAELGVQLAAFRAALADFAERQP